MAGSAVGGISPVCCFWHPACEPAISVHDWLRPADVKSTSSRRDWKLYVIELAASVLHQYLR
jgi:hypothetical protein